MTLDNNKSRKYKHIDVDEENITIDYEGAEEPLVANHEGCNGCYAGAVCLVDGPLPDFEVAGVAVAIKITGW